MTFRLSEIAAYLAVQTALLAGLPVQGAIGQEFFPGNIFELRPPHVRISDLGEGATNPHSIQSFPFFVAPPAIAPQADVRLTDNDLLTLVYPSNGGSFSSGGSALFDRLQVNGLAVELDLFHIALLFSGDTIVPAQETGIFIGRMAAGEYQVNIRNWYLPSTALPSFDPQAFIPPANVIEPTGPIFQIPLFGEEVPPVVTQSSFRFTVVSVPEPSGRLLGAWSLAAISVIFCCRLARLQSKV